MKNQKEFSEQVEETYRSLKFFLFYLGVRADDVPDTAHEVYIKALKAYKSSYTETKLFKTWLFAIAKNTIIDKKRHLATQKNTVSVIPDSTYVESFAEEIQAQVAMKEVISSLGNQDQLIVEFRFFQDLPYKEIANLLDLSEGAVKMRIGRILQKLKEKMEKSH